MQEIFIPATLSLLVVSVKTLTQSAVTSTIHSPSQFKNMLGIRKARKCPEIIKIKIIFNQKKNWTQSSCQYFNETKGGLYADSRLWLEMMSISLINAIYNVTGQNISFFITRWINLQVLLLLSLDTFQHFKNHETFKKLQQLVIITPIVQ